MSAYRLSDLLDMSLIQRLADSNFRASGLPLSIIDAFDTSILVRAGWTDICMKFHRAFPASNQRCLESDAGIKEHLVEGGAYQYKCRNGLWHIAIPIVVAGRHLATMFLTQFYFEEEVPEREFFIRQGREFGYDLDSYLEALDRLPVFSLEKVNYILTYDMALVRFIADLAEQSLRVIETKASLLQSEEKYRTLVNNLNIGVYRCTGDRGRFIQINPAMAEIFGYDSCEEMQDITIRDLYQNPTDRIAVLKEIKQHGFIKDREILGRKKDGTLIWTSATVTAQSDENGNIDFLNGVIEDITERKQAAEALQKAHDELEDRVKERTAELQEALSKVKQLSGLLPICAHCKKIRDDQGDWKQLEAYIDNHSEARFSHGICPDCLGRYYNF